MDPHSSVQPNSDGSVSINFVAQEVGSYEFNVLHNEVQLDGSPLRMYVGMVDKCFLSAYGPGLVHGRSGQKTFFRISRAPKLDDVTVDIEGPEKTEVMKKEDKKGMQVEYVPLTPGDYLINVKVKGNHINGSPFSAKISGLGTKKSVHQISTPGEYSLGVKCSEITGLIAYLKAPSALLEQVSLKKLTNGEIGLACFQPHKKGNYTVDLSHDGSKFKGSPFQINVGDKEVCNLDKVKVSGAVKDGLAGQWNNLVLNVAEAGYGELTVSLEGPFRTDIKSKQSAEKPKEFLVYYRPPEPGSYILGVKYGGEHITKSPFMVNVGGKSSGRVREAVQRNMTGTDVVQVGGTTEFCVTLPGCSPMDMEAELTSPSGSVELCEIRDQPGGKFLVKFTPSEKGLNIVSLKMKGIHVNGSPLPFTVGSSPIGGTHKVEFGGVGLERGVVGVKNEFNVYTREAGAGVLAVAMDGPSKAKLEIVDTHTGFAHVIYSVDKEGEYTIGLKYDGIHIPRSPITIQVDPDCKEAKKITIQALRDRGLEVFKAATFQVNLNGMQGSLAGFLTTPTGAKEEIVIEKLDVDQFMIRFTPQENGLYYVTVKFNDSHIPGSPLPMLVGRLGADPAQIKMEGKGIVTGKAGSLSKFYAITTNAGSGPLCILIEGPSRVAIV